METFKDRLVKEKEELDNKLQKLVEFLKGEQFTTLSQTNQDLLIQQETVMSKYSAILGLRININ